MLLIAKYNDKRKKKERKLECGSYQLIFITTIDLICNVILDHIKKF